MIKLLRPQETAVALGVTVETMATWRSTGRRPDLPWVKIGSRVMYRESDVIAFIEANLTTHS